MQVTQTLSHVTKYAITHCLRKNTMPVFFVKNTVLSCMQY